MLFSVRLVLLGQTLCVLAQSLNDTITEPSSISSFAISSITSTSSSITSTSSSADISDSSSSTSISITSTSTSEIISASSSFPDVSITSSSTSVNVTQLPSANVTISTNASSTATAEVPEVTDTNPDSFYIGDDKWFPDQDTDTPADLVADEQVLTLAYAANQDKNLCLAKARAFAQGSSNLVRRQWGEKVHARRRRRSLIGNRCLAIAWDIPTTIHWVVPSAIARDPAKLKAWRDDSLLNNVIADTNKILAKLNGHITVRAENKWTWQDPRGKNADAISRNIAPYGRYSPGQAAWIKNAREKTGAAGRAHLNVFIVEDADKPNLWGYANFPGKDRDGGQVDAIVMMRRSMNNAKSRARVTLAHEIGHWVGLFHLHQGNCGKNDDRCSDTPRYRDTPEPDYSETCDGIDMSGGLDEHNLMSYADGAVPSKVSVSSEQVQRAVIGYTLYRVGLREDRLTAGLVKKLCTVSSLKRRVNKQPTLNPRDDIGPVPLTKRQMQEELSRFCERSDLVVEDHEFSEIAETGLYNPQSPPLSDQGGIVVIDSGDAGEIENSGGTSVTSGPTYDDVVSQVQSQFSENGKIVNNASLTAGISAETILPSSTASAGVSGSSSGAKQLYTVASYLGWPIVLAIGSIVAVFVI